MSILESAILGGVIGLVVYFVTYSMKEQKFKKLMKSITEQVDYLAFYHYASFKRYKNSFKFFDSNGVLYVKDKTVFYKTSETGTPLSFNLTECSVQAEADWRMLKWFSITTPAGEKYYFNSNKMGGFKNNSDETLKGLAALQAKKAS
jgi:hypothetical protein